jgi:hypothetical protein
MVQRQRPRAVRNNAEDLGSQSDVVDARHCRNITTRFRLTS